MERCPEIYTNGKYVKVKLPVAFLHQDDEIVVYTPALDLSTCGNTREQAIENFLDLVAIFIDDLQEQGTLDEVLEELGWNREDEQWIPPAWECCHYEDVYIPTHAH